MALLNLKLSQVVPSDHIHTCVPCCLLIRLFVGLQIFSLFIFISGKYGTFLTLTTMQKHMCIFIATKSSDIYSYGTMIFFVVGQNILIVI